MSDIGADVIYPEHLKLLAVTGEISVGGNVWRLLSEWMSAGIDPEQFSLLSYSARSRFETHLIRALACKPVCAATKPKKRLIESHDRMVYNGRFDTSCSPAAQLVPNLSNASISLLQPANRHTSVLSTTADDGRRVRPRCLRSTP